MDPDHGPNDLDDRLSRLSYGFKHVADEQDRARARIRRGQWRAALFRKNHGHTPEPQDGALIKEFGAEDKMKDMRG